MKLKLLHTKLSYLELVPEVRNRLLIREVSVGLCKTSNLDFIFIVINANDFTHVLTAAVCIA